MSDALRNAGIALAIIATVCGWVFLVGRESYRVDALQEWTHSHEAMHSNILSKRITAVETRVDLKEAEARKIDNLAYRVTVLEQSAADTREALALVTKTISDLSSDIRLLSQILDRVDLELAR